MALCSTLKVCRETICSVKDEYLNGYWGLLQTEGAERGQHRALEKQGCDLLGEYFIVMYMHKRTQICRDKTAVDCRILTLHSADFLFLCTWWLCKEGSMVPCFLLQSGFFTHFISKLAVNLQLCDVYPVCIILHLQLSMFVGTSQAVTVFCSTV